MENQTRFDLNVAIDGWRNELAAQPNLTQDARRELETHLRDTLAELRQRGLNDDEAFWLARRRTGRTEQLGEEFVKADSSNIWRERIFWLAIAFLLVEYWNLLTTFIRITFPAIAGIDINSMLFYYIIFYGPIIWVVYSLVVGQSRRLREMGNFLLRSRRSFITRTALAGVLLLGLGCLQLYFQMSRVSFQFPEMHHRYVVSQLEWLLIPRTVNFSILIALIAWLMPQKQKASKPDLSLSR
jgi:hypothetical protein